MRRNALEELIKWKTDAERKPMILRGARQVGKTWLMKEFGRTNYKSYVYFNFDEEDELKSIYLLIRLILIHLTSLSKNIQLYHYIINHHHVRM